MDAIIQVAAMVFIFLGFALSLVSSIWFYVIAFKESILWGLACLFIPFASLIFFFMRLGKTWPTMVVGLLGMLVLFCGAYMYDPTIFSLSTYGPEFTTF